MARSLLLDLRGENVDVMLAERRAELPAAGDAGAERARLGRPPAGPPPLFTPRALARVVVRICAVVVRTLAWAPLIVVATGLRLSSGPRLVRGYLQSTGGLFVKLGQILALRYDLLPPRYCAELAGLLDALPAVPTAAIKRAVASSLGKPVEALFATFDDAPLSCASVAQVHAATLPGGERVVVKVVRPGSEIIFRADLIFAGGAAALCELVGVGVRLGLRRLARELASFTREEFDLQRELRNAEGLAAAIAKDGVDQAVPRMFPALSSRSVLTMERIDGVSLSRLIAAVELGDDVALEDWRQQGITPAGVASRLLRSMLVQMLRHRTFHADPHSANIFARRGGGLVFVDFGICGWLDERQWAQQIRMRQALAANRIHAAYAALVADFTFPPGTDLGAFEADVKEILWAWSQASVSPHASIQEKSAGALFLRVFDAVRRAGAGIPTGLMRLFRALVVSDMVILKLDPSIDILGEVRAFMSEELTRVGIDKTARGAMAAPAAFARFAAEAPAAAVEALEWLAEAPGARLGPRIEPGEGPSPLARLLLNVGAAAAGVWTLLTAAGRATTTMKLPGMDIAGHPALAVIGGLGVFVLLRRMATAR